MSRNADLQSRRIAAIPRGVANATDRYVARARNAEIWDLDGQRFIDFAAGIAVLNTGHCHPRVLTAVREQLDRFTHTAFQVLPYEPYVQLAERLNAIAPFSGEAQTILFTTGAEAVENAVKIARRHTGRSDVIAFTGAFHGRTLLASTLTGKVTPYKAGFGNLPAGIHHVPFPSGEVSVEESLRALDLMLSCSVDPQQVAAIIIEPVQGEGGFYPTSHALLRALREICDRYGIMLIVDEVQTGFARTGTMFAIEQSGVEPDIVSVAKALGGGFPLAGVIARKDIIDSVPPGGLGTTYGGSPLACVAALEVLDIIEDEALAARAQSIGAKLQRAIANFGKRNDAVRISAPRGLGAMVAFDVLDENGDYDPAEAKAIVSRALEEGLCILTCGAMGQAIRILVPLTIEDDHLHEGIAMLERALTGAAS
ncbi:aspartate aminotransferase family protein [Altericroceibacterium endophyticum]|uniref:Aminotransferase class III-fold pyridoxal phosphate-dependent enzyme n=1 Tax=Altericroceibacterium endophyticum TaxID=1808508 RepID=A0A6I4T7A1_9SPHN|nr:aminotransferase class III-fold pyridoxal phosphate-dependent enzyme [Altericroceibacterium endophyticum]MXO66687.1 aminotransferase class III-fold pyridoxal phosphate-dependent enzyme [Altericroceibacterium endophyticum]